MATILRKKAPFFCRHKNLAGKLDHLDAVLAESDTELCPTHEAERKAAHDKFWNAPVAPVVVSQPVVHEKPANYPFWPLNDDGSICSPTTPRSL